jgi:transport family protein 27
MMNIVNMDMAHRQKTVLRCKLVIVGDPAVGKTALTQVFQSGGSTYPKNYMMTVGVEFSVKQVPIPDTDVIVELYIFDSAGQSIFNQIEMNAKYWDNTSAVMVVYDISSAETLRSTHKWLQNVRSTRSLGPKMVGCLVGNKTDYRADASDDSRDEVSTQNGEQTAAEMGLPYFETSAQTNTNVEAPFQSIAMQFFTRYEETTMRAGDLAGAAL